MSASPRKSSQVRSSPPPRSARSASTNGWTSRFSAFDLLWVLLAVSMPRCMLMKPALEPATVDGADVEREDPLEA
jgi:hypothetical protein